MQADEGHDAHHHQSAEAVLGVEGDPEATEDQQRKQQHHHAGPDETQLLAHHRKDAVVVLLRQIEELLPALSQSYTQQAAGADGDETLADLPAVAVEPRLVEGVTPSIDTALAVLNDALFHQLHIQHRHDAHAAQTSGHQPALDAAHDHHDNARPHDEDGAGQVRLQHHQNGDQAQHRQIRHDAVAPGLHFPFFLGDTVGKVDHHRQLGDLGGLEGETLRPQPAGGVVVGDGQRVLRHDHQHQQEDGKAQQQLGGPSQPLVVDAGHDHHGKQPQHRKDQLAFEVVCPVAGLIIGRWEAGGKHHHQPHAGKQQCQKQEGKIHGSHEGLALHLGGALLAVTADVYPLPALCLLSLAAALGLPAASVVVGAAYRIGHRDPSFPTECQ